MRRMFVNSGEEVDWILAVSELLDLYNSMQMTSLYRGPCKQCGRFGLCTKTGYDEVSDSLKVSHTC